MNFTIIERILNNVQIKQADFNEYDWIFGMDHENIKDLNSQKPENCRAKVTLLGSYDPSGDIIIRDPYYVCHFLAFVKSKKVRWKYILNCFYDFTGL